jgi:predicted glycogen debranching enzyme
MVNHTLPFREGSLGVGAGEGLVRPDASAEWLEADGLGGFASGTAALVRTRRYHALLLAATTPPTGRYALVNGVEAVVTTPAGTWPLSSQAYAGGVVHPDGGRYASAFDVDPWPRWRFVFPPAIEVEHAIAVLHARPIVTLSWRLLQPRPGVRLEVRPLLSGRDIHALHRENPAFRFEEDQQDGCIVWRPYAGVPGIAASGNGAFTRAPLWYRSFEYAEDRARGLDHVEDLASPGRFDFDLSRGEAFLVLSALPIGEGAAAPATAAVERPGTAAAFKALRARERRRRAGVPTRLHRAADAYVARRGEGLTIVAGYPWFTDWGRDTFIALRGLCLAAGHLDAARAVLLTWAGALSRGMLPNHFPEGGGPAAFNTVDAALWFVVAAHDYFAAMRAAARRVARSDETILRRAIESILTETCRGTRFGIGVAEDGLLRAGEPGTALTWMDARVGDRAVTPRIGKPIEVEALWINALLIGGDWSERWRGMHRRALASFRDRFPIPGRAHLYDVVDADHGDDATFRPNQIFAVGGLPFPLLEGAAARGVVDAVEARLLTPLGLRTLDPADPAYHPRYGGGPRDRDSAYHQGTVWPWLLGPFVEAWVRVRGATLAAKRQARRRFLEPLARHLEEAGLEHVSEVADGDPPHRPGGCPFQAWSVGEILRLSLVVLAEERRRGRKTFRVRKVG